MKLAIAGFGRIVELIHLPLIRTLPEIEVSGVFDITPQRLALAQKRGLPIYESMEDMLGSDADAVLIATPPSSHFEIAQNALLHQKHVLIEKPVSGTYKEALQLKALSEKNRLAVSVFHNRRFDPDYLLVKKIVEEGTLGELLFVQRRHHMFGSGASFGVKSFHPDWRNQKQWGGGALLDWGVHLVDQLLRLELGKPAEARADLFNMRWSQGDVEDFFQGGIRLNNGILLNIETNFASNASESEWIMGGDQATLQIAAGEARILTKGAEARILPLDAPSKHAGKEIYTSFADCVLNGGDLTVTIDQAAETMGILDAFRRSASAGYEKLPL